MKKFKGLIIGLFVVFLTIQCQAGSAVKLFDTLGVPRGINIDSSGNLGQSDGLSYSSGAVSGISIVHKFGDAPDFDTGDGVVTVWDGADDGFANQMAYVYSTTADIDSISSSNTGDTQELKIQGLSATWELVTQLKTLSGQTRVALDTPLIRIFRMKNNGVTDNAGHIYCYVNSTISVGVPADSTKVRAIIQPGNNQTLMAVYTIPAGKTGYLRNWYAALAGANKTSNYVVQLRAREFGKVFQLKHISSLSETGSSRGQHCYIDPAKFLEKVDIEMRVSLTEAVTAAAFSAGFDIVLVDN